MQDTIAAIATPYGVGAISIIRVSGLESIELVNTIFKGKNLLNVQSHTIHYGHIVNDGITFDEVMVSVFKAPKSFTMENTIEINCHGGLYNTNKILDLLCEKGCRLAHPGEFTKRAFLNGRIDLTQAEAIMGIISSENELSLKMANNQLNKSATDLISKLKGILIDQIGKIEVNIDYPEYDDVIIVTNEIIRPKLLEMKEMMDEILEKSNISQVVSTGIKTAIIGRPNVGKSSLLNLLLNEEKAIVSNIEGTTRDNVEGRLNIGGVTLHLIDTAGIRKTKDYIEQIGVERSKEIMKKAELILLVLDASVPLTSLDIELLNLTENKKRIIILNKIDLGKKVSLNDSYVNMSILSSSGLSDLENEVIKIANAEELTDNRYLTSNRQIHLLQQAKNSLSDAIHAINKEMPIDFIEIDLKECFNRLLEITGENYTEVLLDELFSKFCLGK